MPSKRFIMNVGRTTKQGQQINAGKDSAEYQAIVGTITMHPDDMKALGIRSGASVRVRSEYGEVTFACTEGKVPQGMVFVPYGPPTCRLMGRYTDGTGMPTSKGWEVEIEPAEVQPTVMPGEAASQPAAISWQLVEPGRYMPRRTRGSFPGRELG